MKNTAKILRSYERDGITVSVLAEATKDNPITYWLVRWEGKRPGKRGCTSPITSWARAKEIFDRNWEFAPTIEQRQCGGFAF